MEVKFHNTKNKKLTKLNTVISKKLQLLNMSYPYVVKADIFYDSHVSYKGIKKSCEIKLKTSGPEFSVNCFEDNYHKAVENTLKVLEFQVHNALQFATA